MPSPERKRFLLRLDARVFGALQRWARDDLRSLNAQIEFMLRDALARAGRLRDPVPQEPGADVERDEDEEGEESGPEDAP